MRYAYVDNNKDGIDGQKRTENVPFVFLVTCSLTLLPHRLTQSNRFSLFSLFIYAPKAVKYFMACIINFESEVLEEGGGGAEHREIKKERREERSRFRKKKSRKGNKKK